MRYIVVTGGAEDERAAIADLARKVDDLIEDGWLPQGGVQYVGQRTYSVDNDPGVLTAVGPARLTWHNEDWHIYIQAMISTIENEEE